MRLSELLKGLQVKGSYTDVEISDVTADSRMITKGCLFVCIKGAAFDGHSVAERAIQEGAAAVVVQADTGANNQVMVPDTRAAYSSICAAFFGNPSKQLKLIGVTGTNGKTTTTYLIKGLLEYFGKKVGLIGTVQNMIGDQVIPAHYTTPEARELQKLFRDMVDDGCEYCVMEVSSQALAQGRVSGCRFCISVFTNLTQDHLDYHKTMENYLAAKHILFENSDLAVINLDDEKAMEVVKDTKCKVFTYSIQKDSSDYTAKNVKLHRDGVEFELVSKADIGRMKVGIPGRFSVYNAMSAAVVALVAGFPFQKVIAGVATLKGVKGRVEVVPTGAEYTVIIDYAHSPDALQNVISTLREVSEGRIITVFGCGGDRDRTKRPQMGEIAATLSDIVVVTSDNPRTEEPMKIIEDVMEGVKKTDTPYHVEEDRTAAIAFAMQQAQKDDIVLLAGKGHETYQVLSNETIHFDEREIVAKILEG